MDLFNRRKQRERRSLAKPREAGVWGLKFLPRRARARQRGGCWSLEFGVFQSVLSVCSCEVRLQKKCGSFVTKVEEGKVHVALGENMDRKDGDTFGQIDFRGIL